MIVNQNTELKTITHRASYDLSLPAKMSIKIYSMQFKIAVKKKTIDCHDLCVVIVKMREATVNYSPIRNNLTNQLIRSGDRKWSIRYDTLNYLEFRSPDLMAMNLLVLVWLSTSTISTYFRQLN